MLNATRSASTVPTRSATASHTVPTPSSSLTQTLSETVTRRHPVAHSLDQAEPRSDPVSHGERHCDAFGYREFEPEPKHHR